MKNLAFILLLTLSYVSRCQQNMCLLYKEAHGDGFVCIADDTISFVLSSGEYYYGACQIQDSLIVLQNNLLSNKNHHIEVSECDSTKMEIEMTFLAKHFGYGRVNNPDTNTYTEKANRIIVFYDNDDQFKISDTNGVVSFTMDELMGLGDTLSCFVFVDGFPFRTEIRLPVSSGKKHTIQQKRYDMHPFGTIKGRPYTYIFQTFFRRGKETIVFQYGNNQCVEFVYVGKGQSCLGELRKRYPDL